MSKFGSKIGRNGPCPCGSGKKYKKCCLKNAVAEHLNKNKDTAIIRDDQMILMNNVKERFHDKTVNIIDTEEIGLEKMSEVILEYADELLDAATTEKAERKAIMVAIVAWNLALMDDDECNEELENLLKNIMEIEKDSDDWNTMSSVLQALIHKKRTQYFFINRFIVDYSIIKTNKGLYLNIASLVSPYTQN